MSSVTNLVDLIRRKAVKEIPFVHIPAGTFLMGDDVEEPIHKVTLTSGFYMQTTPVTQRQWHTVTGSYPYFFKLPRPNYPVDFASWYDAKYFIQKLNEIEGSEMYRLPTEAQWEYACRAGSTSQFCFGDNENELAEFAWYEENSDGTIHPVAQLQPNAWGLYDMHGNVDELCEDGFEYYREGSFFDPIGSEDDTQRIIRGGAYSSPAEECRSAFRLHAPPHGRGLGFRLVRLSEQSGEPI